MPDPVAQNERTCRNCGTELSGPYCHACGQQDRVGMGFRTVMAQSLASVATPGGRFFETLTGLIASPGALTKAYNSGGRARFVRPFAMLLFAMLVLHGVQWAAGGSDGAISHEQSVNRALDRAHSSLDAYAAGEAEAGPNTPGLLRDESSEARASLSPEERRERALSTKFFTDQAVKAWDPVDPDKENTAGWRTDVAAALAALPAMFPLIGWLLIPALLPVTALILRARNNADTLDQMHFLTFMAASMALALAVGTALAAAGLASVAVIAIIASLLVGHTALHLRGAFELSWAENIWRTAVLVVTAIIVLAIIATGVTLLGFAQ